MQEHTVVTFSMRYSMAPRYKTELWERVAGDPDRAIETSDNVLKHDKTTTVALVRQDGSRWVIKRYNTKSIWHALRRSIRRSRAHNCWTMSELFIKAGISVPDRIAYIEKRFGPFRKRSYFVYDHVEADNLLALVSAHPAAETARAQDQVIALFKSMHTARINHGDMKATNFLVSADGIVLLDLDVARKPDSTGAFRRGYQTDRSRFLKNWVEYPELYARFDAELPV